MKRLAAVIALAALLPLAGCATPYGYSPGAWAYYDDDYDYGQDGYERPITYYGEAEYGRPYGDAYYAAEPYYSEPTYVNPDYAGEAHYFARPNYRCNCNQPHRTSGHRPPPPPAHDSSWYSTYYSVGP